MCFFHSFTYFVNGLIPAAPIKVERHAAGFHASPHFKAFTVTPDLALEASPVRNERGL